MSVEFGVWRINGELERIKFSSLDKEAKLETVLLKDLRVLDPDLMLVGKQVPTSFGKRIDLLAIDAQGDLVVIELKRNKTPRDVVGQALDYASWVQNLSYENLVNIFDSHYGNKDLGQAFKARFEIELPEKINENHRIIIVASELDNSTERIINYLTDNFGVPINAVFFRYFTDNNNEYIARSWLLDPEQVAERAEEVKIHKTRDTWNQKDFYVAIKGQQRSWADCRKYGFVSAGGGKFYSSKLAQLVPGSRVSAYVPGVGYVGIGTVLDAAVAVKDFTIQQGEQDVQLLELPLVAEKMGEYADDMDKSEYVVRVEWITADDIPPLKEKGLFANQNVVCRLTDRKTLDRLKEEFNLLD
ncbi:MAG: DUF91 domain-containing protein [Bacteroidota bacterium]|nr:DUF91 domain-containing protein [Bacteroidota bacterium]